MPKTPSYLHFSEITIINLRRLFLSVLSVFFISKNVYSFAFCGFFPLQCEFKWTVYAAVHRQGVSALSGTLKTLWQPEGAWPRLMTSRGRGQHAEGGAGGVYLSTNQMHETTSYFRFFGPKHRRKTNRPR